MFDFLKSLYQKKINNAEDDIQRMGYQFAQVARNNPEVRAYLDLLCAEYDVDARELDIRFASYLMMESTPGLIDKMTEMTGLEHNETRFDLARQKGISEDLISRAANDPIAKALMLSHLRLAMTGSPVRDADEVEASLVNEMNSGSQNQETPHEIVILDEREDSTMVSHWTVYLCAIENPEGLTLCQLQRVVLGSVDDYLEYDDNGEELNELPDTIGGRAVYGVEDSMILGYDLQDYDSYERCVIPFNETFKDGVSDFLRRNRWDETNLARILQDYGPDFIETQQASGLRTAEVFLKTLPETLANLTNRASQLRYYPDPVTSVSITYRGAGNAFTVFAWEGGPEASLTQRSYSLADRVIEEVRQQAVSLAALGFPINEKSEIRPVDPGNGEWFAAVLYFDSKDASGIEQLSLISNGDFSVKLRGTSQTLEMATEFTKHLTAWFMKRDEEGLI